MDANGLRCWQVADARGFGLSGAPAAGRAHNLTWRADARLLRLDRQQDAPAVTENQGYARSLAQKPSPVADPGGSYAWWDGLAGTLQAGGFGHGATPISLSPDVPPGVPQPTDLAFGTDDILYVARNDAVIMTDRRDRFADARVALAGFRAQRLCPAPGGGAWALDRLDGTIARLSGVPLRRAGYDPPAPDVFYLQEPNPHPPRLQRLAGAKLPPDHEGVAIAASFGGKIAVLAWVAGADAAVFTLERRKLVRRFALEGLCFPYSFAWLGEDNIAVLASDGAKPAVQAFVYELDQNPPEGAGARPLGAFHPLLEIWDGGFVNTLAEVPSYPIVGKQRDTPIGLRRLRALSRTTYARSGSVTIGPFDAGNSGSVWHRLQIEACVPDHAGLRIFAHADDNGGVPVAPGSAGAPDWWLHVIGTATVPDRPDAPCGAWADTASEFPFNPGLLVCPSIPDRSGRFTVLLQRAGRRVRRLEGRHLWLHLQFVGDSQVSPEVAALRVYGARFSYRDRYLPALYGERLTGPDADVGGAATPPDFLERFLGLFEGPLTELEDKVAGAWVLTDPTATPDDALPWLARWIGIEPDPGVAPARLRQMLRAAPWTAQMHGTLGGLMAALELATGGRVVIGGSIDPHRPVPRPGTLALAQLPEVEARALVLSVSDAPGGSTVLVGGAITRGEIVAVECFRLRRTFATILGADLDDANDPLTGGFGESGNSFVGDTLILGDAARREIAAVFAADMPQSAADRAAVAAFFERLAHRVLVLVRASTRTADMAQLARVAAEAAPAHVETTLLPADRPLIVAVASLVGIDTFLTPEPPVRAVRVGYTRVGTGDRVQGNGRLDARADGPVTALPIAVADGPAAVRSGTGFVLSAARSQAAPGHTIARSIWTWL